MKLQLLGTAGGDFPRVDNIEDKFAYLPRVRELGGKNLRRPAQAFIFPDMLIDYYDGQQLETFGIPEVSVKHLFITHAHWDHFRPLEILKLADRLPHKLQVYGNRHVIDALKFADTYNFNLENGRFTVKEIRTDIGYNTIEPEQVITVDDTTIAAVHANHGIEKAKHMIMDLECLNYVYKRNGKTILYALDSSYPFPLTVEFLRQYRIDVAVFDATFGQWPINIVNSGHHNLEMLVETVEELREAGILYDESVLLASHIAMAEIKPHDDLVDDFAQEGITLGYDGLVVEL